MLKSIFRSSIIIPTLRLSGIIGQAGMFRSGLTLNTLDKLIEKLFSDKKSPAVALIINSPGGSPTQSSLIAERIISKSKEKKKKVLAFVEDVAASGGYWLACAADEIFVDQNSVVGSIGVISPGFGFVEFIKKIGIERRVYTSVKSKSFLDPFKAEKKEDIERLKNIQLDLHKDFIKVVEDSRGSKLKKDSGIELFSGEFWSGSKSKELGLIDGIGDVNEVLREKFGEKVVIKKFEKSKGWLSKKLSASNNGQLDQLVNLLEERSIWQRYGF